MFRTDFLKILLKRFPTWRGFLPKQFTIAMIKSHYTQNTHIVGNKANGESQNGCFKKTKHAKFSGKQTFLPPEMHTYMCVSVGKKYSSFGKFDLLCFLGTPVLRFALLPYYRRNILELLVTFIFSQFVYLFHMYFNYVRVKLWLDLVSSTF